MDDVGLLGRALDQTGDLLDHVRPDVLDRPTPCTQWRLGDLADHVVAVPRNFLLTLRGEKADWGHPPHLTSGWGPEFRVAADDLVHAWHQRLAEDGATAGRVDWQLAEIAVHTWDLATALGVPLDGFDPEPAERGLAFMRASLTPDNRGEAFGPERPAPDGAGPYDRIAAFAGRPVPER